jgi:hypothetical protein
VPTRAITKGYPKCGRIAFSADDHGDYYCYACGETVHVLTKRLLKVWAF